MEQVVSNICGNICASLLETGSSTRLSDKKCTKDDSIGDGASCDTHSSQHFEETTSEQQDMAKFGKQRVQGEQP